MKTSQLLCARRALILTLAFCFCAFANSVRAGVVISEFMASNSILQDQDGTASDWIEIHNDSPDIVNLAGWSLTDSESDLRKWVFPSVVLPPNGYLVVFASEKNRAVAGAELHTNFKLSADGEYLALVQPDAVTVAHAYVPNFPRQRSNISYGVLAETTIAPLVQNGANARVIVPTNNSLALSWTARTFNDASWTALNTPIGFDSESVATTLLSVDFNERGVSTSANTQPGFSSFVINSNSSASAIQILPTTRSFGSLAITVSNTAPLGYDDRLRETPADNGAFTDSRLLQDFIFSREDTGNGGLDVAITGLVPNQNHRLTIWSYDSGSSGNRASDWFANGTMVNTGYAFNGSTLPTSNEQYQFTFDATSDDSGKVLLSGRRHSSSAGFGVFLNALRIATLASPSATNVLAEQMLNKGASAYVRVPFTVADPNAFQTLKLRVRYNDGFVAYINGQLVASRQAPGTPQWNSSALTNRSSADSQVYEEITLVNSVGLLVSGANVLAIHGMNVSTSDSTFLILPELEGVIHGTSALRYFSLATPGAENASTGYLGLVEDPTFSVERGFFETPFTVSLTTATAGAKIFWTTNASTPTPDSGTLYTGPINVTGTTLLRAAAFLPEYLPSTSITHTYLFLDQVLQQSAIPAGHPLTWQGSFPADYGVDPEIVNHPNYGPTLKNDLRAIPTLSIVTEHDNFWNPSTGIYVDAIRQGDFYERAASVELFTGTNTTEFQINCGIQMQGNASRDNARTPKHSIRLKFKSLYGASKLNYAWFGSGVEEFDNIILRGCFTDSWATRYSDFNIVPGSTWRGLRYRPEDSLLLRDQWVKDSQRAMGHLSSRSDFVHVYLNGLYWGVYNPSERIDASYMASHLGGLEEDWDVLVGGDSSSVAEPADGNMADWNEMMTLVNAGITDENSYQALAQRVDINNLIDYMMLHLFAESEDWPHHNWYAAHRRANPTNGLPETKWIFLAWDQDITLDQLVTRNRINVNNAESPARIYSQLRNYPEFRRLFGDRVQKHYFGKGALTPTNNAARLAVRAATLDRAIVGESARWGDARKFAIGSNPGTGVTFTRDEWWIPELQKLYTNWFPTMSGTSVARFQAGSLYPAIAAPSFNQDGGDVPFGFSLTMSHTNASGTIYFTTDGNDPREEGSGAIAVSAEAYDSPLTISAVTLVRARVLSGGEWSALTEATFLPPGNLNKLILTELMYNPPAFGSFPGNDLEFLELKNTGTNTLNLSGLIFSGITYTFPDGSTLAPNQFFVLARNSSSFSAKYPGVTPRGVYGGQLSNSGETIALTTPAGATVLSIAFLNTAPWPVAADGAGFSMVPKNPGSSQASDDGNKWRASSQIGGSPGADDPAQTIPAIVINEILSHTDPPQKDSIELFNPTAAAVNISGWFLTDSVGNPRKFRIPNGTILEAGSYTYFDEDDFNSSVGTNVNFAFSSVGESVYLFSADSNGQLTGYTHGFEFGPMFNGVSFGRHLNSVGEEFFTIQKTITLGSQNSGPRVGPIVLNEINYNPGANGDEFIELLNATNTLIRLFDPASPTNTWKVNGINFTFPTNISMAAGELVLVVATNPAAFRAKYNVSASVQIFGPYGGALQNNGETLTLDAPDTPNPGLIPYVVMEEVRYGDNSPWPSAADGGGSSLQRVSPSIFGSEPTNWVASSPTPGRLFDPNDLDGDGMPNAFEMANGLNYQLNDAGDDLDEDGVSNFEEYTNGTSPQVAQNFFQLGVNADSSDVNSIVLDFYQLPGRDYVIEQTATLSPPLWTNWFSLSNATTATPVRITNSVSGSSSSFFKLIVTP